MIRCIGNKRTARQRRTGPQRCTSSLSFSQFKVARSVSRPSKSTMTTTKTQRRNSSKVDTVEGSEGGGSIDVPRDSSVRRRWRPVDGGWVEREQGAGRPELRSAVGLEAADRRAGPGRGDVRSGSRVPFVHILFIATADAPS